MTDNAYINQIIGVCIAAGVSGLVMLIGFVAVYRRFADKEIPAQLAIINTKFDSLDRRMDVLAKELHEMRREIDKHGYGIAHLERWREKREGRELESLEDTANRRRTPRA